LGSFSTLFSYETSKSLEGEDFEKKIEEKHLALDSIKIELIKGREKLRQLKQEEGSYVSQLEQLEKNISVSQSYLKKLNVKMDTTSHTITTLSVELEGENRRLATRQAEMRKRLRNIYKTGQLEISEVVLTSRSMSDLLHRLRYFEVLHNYDMQLLHQIDSTRSSIRIRKTKLENVHTQLSALRQEKESEHGELMKEQESRRILLESVRSQKTIYSVMIKDLENAQQELKKIVAMLEGKRKKARTVKEQGLLSGFEKRKGALPWPVSGKVLSEFGKVVHSVYKTVIMNTGIDISAQKGEKVYCIASGKVAYIGWMRGFGKFAIVDHGGYYTTYAQMEEVIVEKDTDVSPRSVIGVIGDQSIAGGTKLHFEIRKSTEALDPLEWLEKRSQPSRP
jgi:murein hydrolase activator